MKIAYFIGTLRVQDGVGKVLLRMAKYAVAHGHEAVIITGYCEKAVVSPVEVWTVPSIVFPLYKDYRLAKPGQKGFEKKLDNFKPDIIHLHSPDTIAWAGLDFAKENKLPIIATHHTAFDRYLTYYHLQFLSPLLWLLLRRLYNKLNLVTVPSETITEELTKHGINNAVTFPWGTDLNYFTPKAFSADWRKLICGEKDLPIISSISRLTWEKDLRTLAGTYNLLRKKLGENAFRMFVSGHGPASAELQKMMPGAIFKEHLDGQELSNAYASSDIFLFPSSTETFGLVVLEAMACGAVPVVANSGGSMSIVVDKKNGLIAKAKNPEDFYEKTLYLLEHPEEIKKLKENGINYSKDYDWEKILANFFELYKKTINDGDEKSRE